MCVYIGIYVFFLIWKKCIQSTRCCLIFSEETIVDKLKELAILLSFASISNLQIWETSGPNEEYRWEGVPSVREYNDSHNFLDVLSKGIEYGAFIWMSFISHFTQAMTYFTFRGISKWPFLRRTTRCLLGMIILSLF